jgi:hypothetical protein
MLIDLVGSTAPPVEKKGTEKHSPVFPHGRSWVMTAGSKLDWLGRASTATAFVALLAIGQCTAQNPVGVPPNTTPPIEAIIAGMARARAENQRRFRSYVVTRDYKLFGNERSKTKVHLMADISFVPPATKKYTIQKADGAGFGETIVRRMLMSEVEIAKDYASTDFSPDNYDLRFIHEGNVGGQRCYVLELLPKRKNKNLLQGNIWVDAGTYLPRHIEGEPVKTPSWWLRRLRIELDYGEVGGMWLQTALEATAVVRILGPHTIIARDVKYELSDLVVADRPIKILK